MARKQATKSQDSSTAATQAIEPGGVFISHVHEDEPLADAFALLIQNVTAGVVPTYRSTAKQFGEGMNYGEQWFRWICESVKKAHHIVALLTPTSIGRPWILFEAGLGKAEQDSVVFGVGLGITREDAYKGPFAALQNCGTEEKELVKLCKELVEGTPAKPNEAMIAKCVAEFRSTVETHFATHKPVKKPIEDPTTVAVFQALEEMKLMLKDQGRVFEMDAPRPFRRDRDFEHMMIDMSMDMEPDLGLVLVSAMAAQMGHLWVQPLADYVRKMSSVASRERGDSIRFLIHHMSGGMARRGKADGMALEVIERAFDRYIMARRAERVTEVSPAVSTKARITKPKMETS